MHAGAAQQVIYRQRRRHVTCVPGHGTGSLEGAVDHVALPVRVGGDLHPVPHLRQEPIRIAGNDAGSSSGNASNALRAGSPAIMTRVLETYRFG